MSLSSYESGCKQLPFSVPIISTPNSPDSPYLHIERQKTMRKQSYVNLSNTYIAPLSILQTYEHDSRSHTYHRRLDETSYRRLMGRFNLQPEDYPQSCSLWETAPARLRQLAMPQASVTHLNQNIPPAPTPPQDLHMGYNKHRARKPQVPRPPCPWTQKSPTPASPSHADSRSASPLPPPFPHDSSCRESRPSVNSIILSVLLVNSVLQTSALPQPEQRAHTCVTQDRPDLKTTSILRLSVPRLIHPVLG